MIDTKEYAKALFELAEEDNITDAILESLTVVKKIAAENPDYIKLLNTPAVSRAEKLALLDEAFGNSEEILLNFLKILTEKHSAHLVAECADEFMHLYNESRNIETAVVITTQPLSDAQSDALRVKLEKITSKTVVIRNEIDPKLIGGITLRVAGKQYDGSIKARLDAFQNSLDKIIV